MNKTESYQLPQWEASDPIRRFDFNAAFAALDAGVKSAQETADAARAEHAGAILTGMVTVEADTANNTDVITFPEGARLGIVWCYTGVPIMIVPGRDSRMYVESWSAYHNIAMTETTFRLLSKTDPQLRYYYYAVFY